MALACHFATWIGSLGLTSVASSVALVTTQPVWVALLARAFLGERVGRRAAVGIGLAVVGGVAVAGGDFSASPRALLGDLMALAGAIFAGIYIAVGRRARAVLSLGAYVGAVYPLAALVLLGLALAGGFHLTGWSSRTWIALALLGVVPQLLGHSLLNWALRWLSAPLVAVSILAEPVVSTLLAIPVLGEVPGPWTAAAAAATLSGVYLAATGERAAEAAEL